MMNIEIRRVPMDPISMEPDLKKYRRAIDSNTVMVRLFYMHSSKT